jgi:hypothetical protein
VVNDKHKDALREARVNILRTRSRRPWSVRRIVSIPSSPSRSEGLRSFMPPNHMGNVVHLVTAVAESRDELTK